MTYVLENVNAPGQYLANDLDAALDSPLESGDVLKIEHAMKFEDEYDLMCWSADGGSHRELCEVTADPKSHRFGCYTGNDSRDFEIGECKRDGWRVVCFDEDRKDT